MDALTILLEGRWRDGGRLATIQRNTQQLKFSTRETGTIRDKLRNIHMILRAAQGFSPSFHKCVLNYHFYS